MSNRITFRSASLALCAGTLSALAFAPGCSNYKDSGGAGSQKEYMGDQSTSTVDEFKRNDPSLSKFFEKSAAYAVFPKVTKGGAAIGASNGEGTVYQGGKLVGFATVTSITLGAQLGGQTFAELIFFQDEGAFSKFKASQTEFDAKASAVIVRSGAGATNDYRSGVAVFIDRKSTRLNSSHIQKSRMPSSA